MWFTVRYGYFTLVLAYSFIVLAVVLVIFVRLCMVSVVFVIIFGLSLAFVALDSRAIVHIDLLFLLCFIMWTSQNVLVVTLVRGADLRSAPACLSLLTCYYCIVLFMAHFDPLVASPRSTCSLRGLRPLFTSFTAPPPGSMSQK